MILGIDAVRFMKSTGGERAYPGAGIASLNLGEHVTFDELLPAGDSELGHMGASWSM
jgi:hypothetical protein